jgi:squalene-hopene/tetraprenyl-beta-curcumene cyclase
MSASKKAALAAALLAGMCACLPTRADDKKTYDEVADKGVAFLKSKQAKDGSWSKAKSYGLTGVVLIGMLKSGRVTAADESVAKGLKFVEAMIDPKEGHIAAVPKDVRGFHKNYFTSVNLLALKLSGQDKYDAPIAAASKYLQGIQWDEKLGKEKSDPYYGGVGYGPGTRPDMSNTHFFLDAMKASKAPADTYKKALVFVSRCQNLKGETNDQPWAGKIDDGSFIYVLAAPKKDDKPKDEKRPGYGSMTYVGLKALSDCGVAKGDARYKKAIEWVGKNYSVVGNPGLPDGDTGRGYYYYLCMMAQCLDALGVDTLEDGKGKKHDWRSEIIAELAKTQRKDGSWVNGSDRWMEGDANLCTTYALIALSHCKPKPAK